MAHDASAILLLICLHEVWVKATYDWCTALCLCLCLCRPVLTSQSYDIGISTRTTNMSFFSCAYAYACVAAAFTCLQGVRVLMLMLMC